MKIFTILTASTIVAATSILPATANVISDEFQLEVQCVATKGDMLDITLSGETRSAYKGANLQVIAIPSGQVITEQKKLPDSGISDGEPSTTNKFSLFVAPYSPNTTGIKVIGDIQSVNGWMKVNTASNCQ